MFGAPRNRGTQSRLELDSGRSDFKLEHGPKSAMQVVAEKAAGLPKATVMYNKYHYYFSVLAQVLMLAVCSASAFEFSSRALLSNYPNPFDSRKTSTNIIVNTPHLTTAPLNVRIYDLFGYLVREFDGVFSSQFQWDGRDENGNFVSKGGYLCVVLTSDGKIVAIRKIGVIH